MAERLGTEAGLSLHGALRRVFFFFGGGAKETERHRFWGHFVDSFSGLFSSQILAGGFLGSLSPTTECLVKNHGASGVPLFIA